MSKTILYGFVIMMMMSCGTSRKNINVKLSSQSTISKEFGETHWNASQISNFTSLNDFGKTLDLDTFIIAHFLHRPWEYYFFKWKAGKTDSTEYYESRSRLGINSSLPNNFSITDAESIFLLGKRANGDYLIIADANNDNKLSDDSIFIIKANALSNRKTLSDSLPLVRLDNLQGYINEQLITFSKYIRLKPIIVIDSSRIPFHVTAFQLELVSSEHYSGTFKYKGRMYKVETRNHLDPIIPDNNKTNLISIEEEKLNRKPEGVRKNQTMYHVGDTVRLKKSAFIVKQISSSLNEMLIQPLQIK